MALTQYSASHGNVSAESQQTPIAVRPTHPDKVLYPEVEVTKQEVAEYLQDVAEWILPHLKHRPIVLSAVPMGNQGRASIKNTLAKVSRTYCVRSRSKRRTRQKTT
jgi:DNA primase